MTSYGKGHILYDVGYEDAVEAALLLARDAKDMPSLMRALRALTAQRRKPKAEGR